MLGCVIGPKCTITAGRICLACPRLRRAREHFTQMDRIVVGIVGEIDSESDSKRASESDSERASESDSERASESDSNRACKLVGKLD